MQLPHRNPLWRFVLDNGPLTVLETAQRATLIYEDDIYSWARSGHIKRGTVLGCTVIVALFIGACRQLAHMMR